ncbi:glutathione S-transferase [Xylariaceae sp. FL1272]|nr:glutathione S-transferase [Xylariaceae sp. FL1272]
MQPIKIWNGRPGGGPNPWKVILVLAELGLPYEHVWVDYGEIKEEPYLSLNPNGRLPAMVDPNTGVTLFESGAIINYIVDVYDKEHKLTYGPEELEKKYLVQSWLMLQMSGQGPMFGQKIWFTHFHVEENLTSVIERYRTEVGRICGVINGVLNAQRKKLAKAQDEPVWLVGDKVTYADLSFVLWNTLVLPQGDLDYEHEYPEYWRWHEKLVALPAVKKVLEEREECLRTLRNSADEVRNRQADARKL